MPNPVNEIVGIIDGVMLSTGIWSRLCKQNRKFIGLEFDPKYYKIAAEKKDLTASQIGLTDSINKIRKG